MPTPPTKAERVTRPTTEACECGCGKRTVRRVRLLLEQDRGTAESLRWAEASIAPMRVRVALARGCSIPDGYVDESEVLA